MAGFLSDLASKAGLEDDQAHQGIGALLSMLKSRMDPATFAHVQNAIPNSDQMLSGFEDKKQWASSGLMSAVKGMAGKLMGGEQDPAAALESHFASIGLTSDHIKSLLPKLHDALANKLPPQVMDQIKQHVPGFAPAAAEEVQQEQD
jgi:Protein of unknown function VcgC/VcgE (DUF2780)